MSQAIARSMVQLPLNQQEATILMTLASIGAALIDASDWEVRGDKDRAHAAQKTAVSMVEDAVKAIHRGQMHLATWSTVGERMARLHATAWPAVAPIPVGEGATEERGHDLPAKRWEIADLVARAHHKGQAIALLLSLQGDEPLSRELTALGLAMLSAIGTELETRLPGFKVMERLPQPDDDAETFRQRTIEVLTELDWLLNHINRSRLA